MGIAFEPAQLALATEKLSHEKLTHSLAVAELAARQGPAYATVGLLHDTLEDSDVTLDELRAVGVDDAELKAIQLLTRDDSTPYAVYVATVAASHDRLAISVKLADLLDHLDPAANASLTDEKTTRYLSALPLMVAALRELNQD